MATACIGIIAAAGTGSRMGSNTPKQYLALGNETVLHKSIRAMLTDGRIERLYVAVSPDDSFIDECDFSMFGKRLHIVRTGGINRSDTVLNTLNYIQSEVKPSDWILVHDAARPCLSPVILANLINETMNDPVGAILAIPVADTIKKVNDQQKIIETIDRKQLWQAQTPQMFRYQCLMDSLKHQTIVTDEASAVEAMGHSVSIVTGPASNIKITYPEDIHFANLILQCQQSSQQKAKDD